MTTTLKLNQKSSIARTEHEVFGSGPKSWKRGQITNPSWLKRENGYDFVTIKSAKELEDFARYIKQEDDRLSVQYYNTYTTLTDKNENPMIVLNDIDENGDTKKIAMIVVLERQLAMMAVEIVENACGED